MKASYRSALDTTLRSLIATLTTARPGTVKKVTDELRGIAAYLIPHAYQDMSCALIPQPDVDLEGTHADLLDRAGEYSQTIVKLSESADEQIYQLVWDHCRMSGMS